MKSNKKPALAGGKVLQWFAFAAGIEVLGLFLYYAFALWRRVEDDAYISFAYARNLLEGNGLTWNGIAVEGYTNFLFILLTAFLHAVTSIDMVWCARLINFISVLGIVVLTWRIVQEDARRNVNGALTAIAALVLVAGSLVLVAGIFNALESPFFAFLCGVCLWRTLRIMEKKQPFTRKEGLLLGTLLALTCLTRPEGIIMTGFCGLWLHFITRKQWLKPHKNLWATAGSWCSIIVPYLAWKYYYYGDILPNTYYVKIHTGDGLLPAAIAYLVQFFLSLPLAALFSVVGALYLIARKRASRPVLFLFSFTLLYCAYTLYTGSDFMPYFRFILPVTVATTWLLVYVLKSFATLHPRFSREMAVLFVITAALQPVHLFPERVNNTVLLSKAHAAVIVPRLPAGSLIALNGAGYMPYAYPQYRYIDMLGLNDPHIAHADMRGDFSRGSNMPGHLKADGKYVLDQAPDIILMSGREGSPRHRSDWQLISDPRYRANYIYIPYVPDAATQEEVRYVRRKSNPALPEADVNYVVFGIHVHKRVARYFADMMTGNRKAWSPAVEGAKKPTPR